MECMKKVEAKQDLGTSDTCCAEEPTNPTEIANVTDDNNENSEVKNDEKIR